jgi:dsDNA-binding SOS-regulon protein
MSTISKREADAWDRVIDAAAELADLVASSAIEISELDLEELTIFLAVHGVAVRKLLRHVKRAWPLE